MRKHPLNLTRHLNFNMRGLPSLVGEGGQCGSAVLEGSGRVTYAIIRQAFRYRTALSCPHCRRLGFITEFKERFLFRDHLLTHQAAKVLNRDPLTVVPQSAKKTLGRILREARDAGR